MLNLDSGSREPTCWRGFKNAQARIPTQSLPVEIRLKCMKNWKGFKAVGRKIQQVVGSCSYRKSDVSVNCRLSGSGTLPARDRVWNDLSG